MSSRDKHNDSEDMFADTRMSFGDHIEDLRTHLIRALTGFAVAMFFSLFIARPVLEYIKAPVREQLEAFYARRAKDALRERDSDPKLKGVNRPQFVKMDFLSIQLQAAQQGKAPPQQLPPLPEDGEPRPYLELVNRCQLDTLHAFAALNQERWD